MPTTEELIRDIEDAVPHQELATMQDFVRYCTTTGLILAQGAEMLAKKVSLTPELRKKISGGSFAIGEERGELMSAANMAGYAMAYFACRIMNDTTVESAVANIQQGAQMQMKIMADYLIMKEEGVCIDCKNNETVEFTPEMFF